MRTDFAPTLVIADYPVGYASGFGETLFNLFSGFPSERLWTAHPGHLAADENKRRAQSISLPSPARPSWMPQRISLAYYPLLKAQQFSAVRETVRLLSDAVRRHSIRNLLVVPVTPWILSAALTLHRKHPALNLVFYVMDDWQGHHECHQLPYSAHRRRLLREAIERANVRIAVSREMAVHYVESFGKRWLVAHNGVRINSFLPEMNAAGGRSRVLLAGDVNVFRSDAVIAFAQAIERHNQRNGQSIEFTIMGEVAEQHRGALTNLRAVKLLSRRSHSECLNAMSDADLLYLPLAFCERSARISLYSMPTKLPEYLAAGKTVLFHAPKDSAMFQVAERYDLRPRLDTVDPQALDDFVAAWSNGNHCHNDTPLRAHYALREEFDIEHLATCFQAAFTSAS